MVDEKKICFIMCTNNELQSNEAMYFINKLNVPDGYSIDILTVWDAESITSGYNEGMEASNAKYKIYLHQDVLIIERDFISKLLKVFEDKSIGMIGMVGCEEMPENMVMWYGLRVGQIFEDNGLAMSLLKFQDVEGDYQEVQAIDGLLMATQYDIRWREDILNKWDFYDVSQSLEFIRKGYKVVVPKMINPWCIHDDGKVDLKNYYTERKKIVKEYCM